MITNDIWRWKHFVINDQKEPTEEMLCNIFLFFPIKLWKFLKHFQILAPKMWNFWGCLFKKLNKSLDVIFGSAKLRFPKTYQSINSGKISITSGTCGESAHICTCNKFPSTKKEAFCSVIFHRHWNLSLQCEHAILSLANLVSQVSCLLLHLNCLSDI